MAHALAQTTPANRNLPDDLQLLQQLIAERPQKIALLLPQQGKLGKAGRAVRDGFMAAYYQAKQQNNQTPQIILYDSHAKDVIKLYEQAVSEGVQLIIGPLDKPKVTQLSQLDQLPVATLAVNYSEQTRRTSGPQPLPAGAGRVKMYSASSRARLCQRFRHPLQF